VVTRNIRKPGDVGILNFCTFIKYYNGLTSWSFEIPASAYCHRYGAFKQVLIILMKRLYILSWFLFLFIPWSFSQNIVYDKQIHFLMIRGHCWNLQTIDTLSTELFYKRTDSIYNLEYRFSDNDKEYTKSYVFSEKEKFDFKYFQNGNEPADGKFIFEDFATYQIDSDVFHVYKFITGYQAIDGSINHFWCPDFGIILTRSTTWCNYDRLIVEDELLNWKLNRLIEMMILDYKFYYGSELIPLEEFQEYLKWWYEKDSIDRIIRKIF